LEEEIKAFEADIQRLDEHATLMTSASAAMNGNAVSVSDAYLLVILVEVLKNIS